MNMKGYLLVTIIVIVIAAGGALYFEFQPNNQVACTMEAKLCPDGSAVGRVGPNCEFSACPNVVTMGFIKGKVEVGPICPVERVGVPCPVPPEAYTSREVILYAEDGKTIVKQMHFASDGTYSFEVPAGIYVLNIPAGGVGGSGELPKTLTVKSGETIEFNFSIDTGIR